jgi:ADP-ribose pyrophosphatase YjhB (NUDIX family)
MLRSRVGLAAYWAAGWEHRVGSRKPGGCPDMGQADVLGSDGDHDEVWAPEEIFESILKYSVVPTFDLILKGTQGVLLVKRRIAPYYGLWALPGLRIFKDESLSTCLARIAEDEVGLRIGPSRGTYVNQSVVRFSTRQDLSTCYAFELDIEHVKLNEEHLSDWTFVKTLADVPAETGDLYREHLRHYFEGLES